MMHKIATESNNNNANVEKKMYRKKMTHETMVTEANEKRRKKNVHPKKKTERNRLQNNGKIKRM